MELAAEIRDLHKYYDLGMHVVKALRGVTAEFPTGDFVAIMGASGSGKSTLLNVLGALDRPTAGQYLLGGRDTSQLTDDDLSTIRNEMIGFIFQSYNLIPQFTVLENIEVPLHYRPAGGGVTSVDVDWCVELADRVGLVDRLDHRPTQLSGGQQQRVAIARALVNDPQIILADEPTGNLDSETEQEIMQVLVDLNNEGRTILMVTHEVAVAQRANRQIVLKDGVKVFDDVFSADARELVEATAAVVPPADETDPTVTAVDMGGDMGGDTYVIDEEPADDSSERDE